MVELAHRIAANIEQVHRGQAGGRPARAGRAARRGPPADRGRARRRQDDAGQGAGPLDRLLGPPDPVHPGPAAQRRHRRVDLQPADPRVRVPARPGVRQHRGRATRSTGPRPRPSPRCWSAWRSARSPSTATTYQLASPFLVVATQNPIEMEGTYPLPEAQRDRFMARVSIGYPDRGGRAGHARRARRRRPAGRSCARSPTPPPSSAVIETVRRVQVGPEVRAVLRRPRQRHPAAARAAAGRLPPGDPAAACGPPAPRPRWPAATTWCPTTCRPRRPGAGPPPAADPRRAGRPPLDRRAGARAAHAPAGAGAGPVLSGRARHRRTRDAGPTVLPDGAGPTAPS